MPKTMTLGIHAYSEELECTVTMTIEDGELLDYGTDDCANMAVRMYIEPKIEPNDHRYDLSVDLNEPNIRGLITVLKMCLKNIQRANKDAAKQG